MSGIDRALGLIAIKPSGVEYEELTPANMVLLDLEGRRVEGDLNPSSDTRTHVRLYKEFPEIGGVVHTHSLHATAWAQARLPLPCLGTTHADYFHGPVPCTEVITDAQIALDYEEQTAVQIINAFKRVDYREMPGGPRGIARTLHVGHKPGGRRLPRFHPGARGAHERHFRLGESADQGSQADPPGQALSEKAREKRVLRPEEVVGQSSAS